MFFNIFGRFDFMDFNLFVLRVMFLFEIEFDIIKNDFEV